VTDKITAYKGLNQDLTCRGYQYEIGGTYEHQGGVKACNKGFHACEYPLDVFSYYAPASSRYAVVEQSGGIDHHNGDSKVASSKITISAEITLPGLVKAAIEYTISRCKPVNPESPASSTGDQGAASSTGHRGAASSTGDQGAASSTGYQGAASSTGYQGAASSTGDQGAASSTGYHGAASSTGYQGAASSTGYHGAASSTGRQGAASSTGRQGAAMASGYEGRVMGAKGSALFLVERNDDLEIVNVWSGIVGRDGVKADTWYSLKSGYISEVE
jgi:hypothetical protein